LRAAPHWADKGIGYRLLTQEIVENKGPPQSNIAIGEDVGMHFQGRRFQPRVCPPGACS
jgi:hypothetical protein